MSGAEENDITQSLTIFSIHDNSEFTCNEFASSMAKRSMDGIYGIELGKQTDSGTFTVDKKDINDDSALIGSMTFEYEEVDIKANTLALNDSDITYILIMTGEDNDQTGQIWNDIIDSIKFEKSSGSEE